MKENHLDRALKKILQFSAHFNQYFQHKEPWKNGPGTNSCVFFVSQRDKKFGNSHLIPSYLSRHKKFGYSLDWTANVSAQMFDEISNITLKQGHKLGSVSPLFEKVEESVIEEQKSKLGASS